MGKISSLVAGDGQRHHGRNMAREPIRFARIDFRNDDRVFGIKTEDRFLHMYIIGKTGTGKSSLIETMALQDAKRGNGFALISLIRTVT
ncbi:hypothetical protein [Bradyrhizobium liaoningense]